MVGRECIVHQTLSQDSVALLLCIAYYIGLEKLSLGNLAVAKTVTKRYSASDKNLAHL